MLVVPGTVIERYVVMRELGQGGMATVYLAKHSGLGTLHALKVLTVNSPSVQDRLIQEGRIQGALSHPHVVSVTDLVDVGGSPGLVMEFISGPSLDRLLIRGRLPLEQVDVIARHVIHGVAAAHTLGLVHRDLKPGNVMIQVVGQRVHAKVTDFGLAKVISGPTTKGVTRSGMAMGTPGYMAPEQVKDAAKVDHRADLWSLGAMLYEMVVGVRPFGHGTMVEIFDLIRAGAYRPVREVAPHTPERMIRAIEACMRLDPAERVQSCESLLALWEDGETVSATPPWRPEDLEEIKGMGAVGVDSIPSAESAGATMTFGPGNDSSAQTMGNSQQLGVLQSAADATTFPEEFDTPRRSLAPLLLVLPIGGVAVAAVALLAIVGVVAAWWVVPRGPVVERYAFVDFGPQGLVGRQVLPDDAEPLQWFEVASLGGRVVDVRRRGRHGLEQFQLVQEVPVYDGEALVEVRTLNQLGAVQFTRQISRRDDEVRVRNLGSDEQPTAGPLTGALVEVHVLNDGGAVGEVRYENERGEAMATHNGTWGERREYDGQGRRTGLMWLGRHRGGIVNASGVMRQTFAYADERWSGLVSSVESFGWADIPVSGASGCHVTAHQYDGKARPERLECRDASGQPMPDALGCTAWTFEYAESASDRRCERDGQPSPTVDGWVTETATYSADGALKSLSWFDVDGDATAGSGGLHAVHYERDERGALVGEGPYLDTGGQRVLTPAGHGGIRYSNDERGQLIRKDFLGLSGEVSADARGVAVVSYERNAVGIEVAKWCLGRTLQPVECQPGWHRVEREVDSRGIALVEGWFDVSRKPTAGPLGAVRVESTVDPHVGRFSERRYLDATGQLTLNIGGYAMERRSYDSQGRESSIQLFGEDEKPVLVERFGGASRERLYDASGHVVETAWYGVDGKPYGPDGTAVRVVISRDERGLETERTYFGADGRPAPARESDSGELDRL